jgi:hemolysin activation/secretion protein
VGAHQGDDGAGGATLSGAGLGLNWTGAKGWTAALGVARPIGRVPALAGHAESVRIWGEIHKAF